jgi:hypothetical protein
MAMKVSKTSIQRLSVDMSCGCRMYSEFTDAQCKVSVIPWNEEEGQCPRTFIPCDKHKEDASLSMLEFIIGERLDEGIAEAQKTPAAPVHLHPLPQEGDTGGVPGGQSVAKVNRPAAVNRARPEGGPTLKTLTRNTEQLAKSGAILNAASSTDVMLEGGAEEDEATTDDLLSILDEHDPTANEG